MPVVKQTNEAPDSLKPYIDHGLDLQGTGVEKLCECPFCGREKKFSVNEQTGQWRCFVCGGDLPKGGGGILDFLEKLHETSERSTRSEDYHQFAQERGLEYPETLIAWRIVKSSITGNWLIPGWGFDYQGKLQFQQLYRYIYLPGERRYVLLPTKGRKHTLIGVNLYDSNKPDIYVCEGPWDGLRLWEVMRSLKPSDDGLFAPTAPGGSSSLIQGCNVLAAATCSAFPPDNATKLFKGKDTIFLYDSDFPRKHPKTGEDLLPAGLAGMKRDVLKINKVTSSLRYIHWSDRGFDPELKDGYDVRDALSNSKIGGLGMLLSRTKPVPTTWFTIAGVTSEGKEIGCRPCETWDKVRNSWRKALKWTHGLDHGLASCLACISSTGMLGDQLWLKLIGPASSAKSTLAEAFSVNKKYVLAKSTFRGFHSGYQTDRSGKEDNSLLKEVDNKTFIIKDGDTLLQSPNRDQILSEGRDIYDGVSRTHYRNKMSKDYENMRMTWILCGTSSLRAIDSSELGERFLDCVIMHRIDEDIEDEILWRKVNQAEAHVNIETNGESVTHQSPEMLEAMELTGGYINWLRESAARIMPSITMCDTAKRQCVDYGKFVAFMRARPSERQQEEAERELAARLVSQHTRYAKCVSLALNRPKVDQIAMERTRQICMDTARGNVLKLTNAIYKAGPLGKQAEGLIFDVNLTDGELRKLLRFMKDIRIIRGHEHKSRRSWVLTPRFKALYEKVHNPTRIV